MATNDDIIDALLRINDTLDTKLDAIKDEVEKSDDNDKDRSEKNLKPLDKAAKRLQKGLPSIETAVTKGSKAVEDAIKQSFALQKTALSRGLNLNKVVEAQTKSSNNLAGNLTGFSNMYQIQMEKFESGINSSSKEMEKLALFTKLTGGDSKKLVKQLANLNFGMSMTTEQNASLSKTIMSMSQNYQMTTDELMSVIGALDKAMPMYKLLGIGPEISEATARLGAALGQESGTMAADMIQALTTAEGMVLASQLGVADLRMAVLKKEGNVAENSLKMVQAAGAEASRIYKSYLDNSGDPAIAYKAVEDALGPAMAKSAMTYMQMEQQAAKQGQTIEQYMKEVAKQNNISNEFSNTLENFYSTAFAPLEYVMTKVVQGVTLLTGLLEYKVIRVLVQLTATVAALVVAFKAFKLMGEARRAISNAASGATSAASGAGGGGGGGIGKGLAGLGKGISKLGTGIGKGLGGILKGIAKGIAAFGTSQVLKAAVALIGIGFSLVVFAKGLQMIKGVGAAEIITMAAALVVFAGAAYGLGYLLGGPQGIFFAIGVAAIAGLGIALIPVAYALKLVTKPMASFALVLRALASINPFSLMLLGPALVGVSAGLVALTGSSVLGGIANFFMGDNNPIDKLIKLGKAAKDINLLASSLRVLTSVMSGFGASLKSVSEKDVAKLAKVKLSTGAGEIGGMNFAYNQHPAAPKMTTKPPESGKMTMAQAEQTLGKRYTDPAVIAHKRSVAEKTKAKNPDSQASAMLVRLYEKEAREAERTNQLLEQLVDGNRAQYDLERRMASQSLDNMNKYSPLDGVGGLADR